MFEGKVEKVLNEIDQDELVELTCDLIDIPSPTGHEKEIAEYIIEWLRKNGFRALCQEIEHERFNAIGILPGKGGGKTLSFNGHLDTSFSGGEEDLKILKELIPAQQPKSFIEEQTIFGLGAVNDKGPVAAFLIAAKAIKNSGVTLNGTLYLAAVAGEIGKAQIDSYQGSVYRGKGLGTRYLLNHGIVSDYAINTEPSGFGLTWAMPGAAFFKITTYGEAKYSAFTNRSELPQNSESALIKMLPVIHAVEKWGTEFEINNSYKFENGTIIPKVTIGAISGGAPYKPNFSPGVCSIYVDVRVPPNIKFLSIQNKLRELVNEVVIEADVEMYLSQKGYESQGVKPLVETISSTYYELFNERIPKILPPYTSCWGDLNIYSEVGIPAVKIGPAPNLSTYGGQVGGLSIEDLIKTAKLYSIIALKICNL